MVRNLDECKEQSSLINEEGAFNNWCSRFLVSRICKGKEVGEVKNEKVDQNYWFYGPKTKCLKSAHFSRS